MSNRAQAQYIRIFIDGGADQELLQNFYVNSTVTVSSKDYEYYPFEFEGLVESSAIGGQNVNLTLPATKRSQDIFLKAAYQEYLIEVKVFEFDGRLGLDAPQSGQQLISTFFGRVSKMSGSFSVLNVELGTALDPIGAQVPPRTYNTTLVGAPIRL